MHISIPLSAVFLVISIVYSMAGQGGGSAYLGMLALAGVPYSSIPSISLSCNIVGTLTTVYLFHRAGHFRRRLALPFLTTSLPAAFIGGTLAIGAKIFNILLVIALIAVAILMFLKKGGAESEGNVSIRKAFVIGPLIGIPLGLIAGIVGIGGGVFLLPIIIFLKWGGTKEAAAAGGFFTLVNSASGLVGHGIGGTIDIKLLVPLAAAVVIGSQIGARLGSGRIRARVIEKIFALILLGVAAKLVVNVI